ncbi:MAG TPA: aminotransferase class III-fold pyridoxal phosphate-dependent enzyme, partial [Gemmata sp.]|nr:aminotransferase class III-fold pyridoxal phosphate-dependent enzyme [Gemmata sp.]
MPINHPGEPTGNRFREDLTRVEPRALRTFTPTQAVIARSAGIYHWLADGRRLYDFTSGVLVSNLGHNPTSWMERFSRYMGWSDFKLGNTADTPFFPALPMTAYNAATTVEIDATRRLLACLRKCSGGARMEQVMWAASGSEAIQKGLWAAMARDRTRTMILATRFGFHGKKGLANAVTGSETDAERDPRVRFISFPTAECRDVSLRDEPFDPSPYQRELDVLLHQYGRKIGTLITEPYLGGGGSYHPPKVYLQLLERFCRDNDIVFI